MRTASNKVIKLVPAPEEQEPKGRIKGLHNLTALFVKTQKRRGRYCDGGGLYLSVSKTGSKSWIFMYSKAGGMKSMGLGSVRSVTLAQARDQAALLRMDVRAGTDPIAAKDAERVEARIAATSGQTFKEAAVEFITMQAPAWRNQKSEAQWLSSLTAYVFPLLGRVDVAEIDTPMVLKVLKPIWSTKPETAGRIRGRIKNILDAAKAAGKRSGDNPAAWDGHLSTILPSLAKLKKVRHMPAMPWAELPAFMKALQKRDGISPLALSVLILTATRTGSLIAMQDPQLDYAAKVWTIPAETMKGGKEFRVPLTDKAIAILKGVPRERNNAHLFAGLRSGSHLSNMALLSVMQNAAPDYVPHGMRSSFSDWAHETNAAPHHVIEMSLAHTIDNKVEAAYRRGDLLDQRRELMVAWERFLFPGQS